MRQERNLILSSGEMGIIPLLKWLNIGKLKPWAIYRGIKENEKVYDGWVGKRN
jgi:hypothetical protein